MSLVSTSSSHLVVSSFLPSNGWSRVSCTVFFPVPLPSLFFLLFFSSFFHLILCMMMDAWVVEMFLSSPLVLFFVWCNFILVLEKAKRGRHWDSRSFQNIDRLKTWQRQAQTQTQPATQRNGNVCYRKGPCIRSLTYLLVFFTLVYRSDEIGHTGRQGEDKVQNLSFHSPFPHVN
jgi:hypothetical protein